MIETEAPSPALVVLHRAHRVGVSLVVSLLVVAGVATYFTLRHLDDQYGPIEGGSFSGQYSQRNFVSGQNGFTYRLAATPGATGELIESLDNRGAHTVTITTIEPADSVASIRWSVYRVIPGGYSTGVDTPWQSFPAHVPAHGTIRLLVTIQRPANCVAGEVYDGSHLVHWKSLRRDHTTAVNLWNFPNNPGIPLC